MVNTHHQKGLGIMKKTADTFFETFAGEFLEIVQDFDVTTSFNMGEHGPQEVRMPMTVTGFLMDSDGEFLYLSPDGEEINQALPIDSIKHIGIVELKDPEQSILDDVPEPENDLGFN